MSNNYKKILPLADNMKISDQFGRLPLSVIEPSRKSKVKWKDAYLDDGIKELIMAYQIIINNDVSHFRNGFPLTYGASL